MGFGILSAFVIMVMQPAQIGPPVPPPPPVRRRECSDQPPAEGEEIVVCGEVYDENSPYRVPQQFRNQRTHDDVAASWTSRVNDEESVQRFSSQNVGAGGASQHSRQVDCQWRAARQEAQGRRPDCGARVRPNEATDWQRR